MFNMTMLPAGHGDCLWLEYGETNAPHRFLIDGGTAPTYRALRTRIAQLPSTDRYFDLFIITHVDADHIEGAVRLLSDTTLGVTFGDVWFNGWQHLPAVEVDRLGPVQGEYLTAVIEDRHYPWNVAFDNGPVVVPEADPLPHYTLPGGLQLTLLSPLPEQLIKLRSKWNMEVRKAGLAPGVTKAARVQLAKKRYLQPDALGEARLNVEALAGAAFEADTAEANGSSIAVLAEFEGKRCLLTGDAFAPVLATTLQRLLDERQLERLALNAFKLPHHGSKANISTDLLKMVRCQRYLFSTNSKIFNHPDVESVARVILHGGPAPSLFFNYRTDENEVWDEKRLITKYDYRVTYPAGDTQGLLVKL
jgi:beta-lactamase superfamily II metal-dependent hydrolase